MANAALAAFSDAAYSPLQNRARASRSRSAPRTCPSAPSRFPRSTRSITVPKSFASRACSAASRHQSAALLHSPPFSKWFTITIEEHEVEKFRQEGRGRPTERTRYVREAKTSFEVKHRVEYERLAAEVNSDGFFPLITNELSVTERDLLLAYKGQPALERRFAQLKTDFEVAPVYLQEVSRIAALLCMYFFVLLVEALLERELRRAMARSELASLPLYPEGRACGRPTARRVIDLFEEVQCHELRAENQPPVNFTTELTPLQRKVLRLLGMSKAYDG